MDSSSKVILYVYDLSMGMIPDSFAQQLNGIKGIYHTGIVVYGREYYYSGGVQQTGMPGTTHFGKPTRKEELGDTMIPKVVFDDFLAQIGRNKFRMDQYDLFKNNCNSFTNECAQFLLGRNIPDEIKNLPGQFLNSPLGKMVKPFLDQMMGGIQQSLNQGHGGTQQQSQPQQQQSQPQQQQQSQPQQQQQNPFGGMGGMPGFGNQDMSQMMNNPMVQQMMQNPQMMQQAMQSPQVQQMMSNMGVDQNMLNQALNNPQVRQMMQNPQMMQQAMQMMQQQGGMPGMGNFGGYGGYGNNSFGQTNTSNYRNPYASNPTPAPKPEKKIPEFQDKKEIYRFKKSNVPAIIKKIKSSNKLNDQQTQIVDNMLKFLTSTSKDFSLITEDTWKFLIFLLSNVLEKDSFPILDCIRLLVLNTQCTKQAQACGVFSLILELYLKEWNKLSMPTQLMCLRIFSNIFQANVFKEKQLGVAHKLIQDDDKLFSQLSEMVSDTISSAKLDGLRLTAASLACNIALFAKKDNNDSETQLLCSMLEFLNDEKKTDIAFVMLLTMSRLMKDNSSAINLVKDLNGKETIQNWKKKTKREDALSLVNHVLAML